MFFFIYPIFFYYFLLRGDIISLFKLLNFPIVKVQIMKLICKIQVQTFKLASLPIIPYQTLL